MLNRKIKGNEKYSEFIFKNVTGKTNTAVQCNPEVKAGGKRRLLYAVLLVRCFMFVWLIRYRGLGMQVVRWYEELRKNLRVPKKKKVLNN